MGKLVLGITAVTLLQVAFFVYVKKDGADYMTVGEIAARSDEKSPELARANELAEVVVPMGPPTPTFESSEVTKIKTSSATGRSVSRAKPAPIVHSRDRSVRSHARVPSTAYARSAKSPVERIVVPTRASASIPRGYTMTLVDYTSMASVKRSNDISKPRKRSYLARALPALVKKPWRWIKSMASNLN